MHAHQPPDGSGIRGAAWGAAGGLCGWGELCRGMHTSQMVHTYTHCLQYCQHKEDSPLFSHQLPPVPPLSLVSAHSSSQVVHCRVFPPLPLHAPVLVLHLAVYSASPTQGRVGLTDRLLHSAQTQCNVSSCLRLHQMNGSPLWSCSSQHLLVFRTLAKKNIRST